MQAQCQETAWDVLADCLCGDVGGNYRLWCDELLLVFELRKQKCLVFGADSERAVLRGSVLDDNAQT